MHAHACAHGRRITTYKGGEAKPSQVKILGAARSLAFSAPAMLIAASCGAGTIETAVTSATEAAVVVVVVHIWMKIGTSPVEHLCPRHASHIYGGRGDALGAPLDPRGPQRRRHHPVQPVVSRGWYPATGRRHATRRARIEEAALKIELSGRVQRWQGARQSRVHQPVSGVPRRRRAGRRT